MNELRNIQDAMQAATEFVQATWQQAVMGTQTVPGMKQISSNIGLRKIYAGSIVLGRQLRSGSGLTQSVLATSKIAQQLEHGTGPWDMKPMLLNGPKARAGKNGKYNIIPFRHGTNDSYSPNSNFKPMAKDIYAKARQLKASVKQGNGMKWGGRLPAQGPAGQNKTTGYQHKNEKHEGMVRIEKTYAKATQSQYMTFRIVSEKSDPNSWIHPGYQAHNIARNVSDFCKPAVEQMIGAAAEADLQQVVIRMGLN